MGKTLIGTTDTDCDERAEADGHAAGGRLSAGRLTTITSRRRCPTADVLGTFAGLRPLIRAQPGEPSTLSREFQIHDVAVGPADRRRRQVHHLSTHGRGHHRRRRPAFGSARRCSTRSLRLDGAPDQPWQRFAPAATAVLTRQCHLEAETAHHLIGRYGRRALEVADYLERDPR